MVGVLRGSRKLVQPLCELGLVSVPSLLATGSGALLLGRPRSPPINVADDVNTHLHRRPVYVRSLLSRSLCGEGRNVRRRGAHSLVGLVTALATAVATAILVLSSSLPGAAQSPGLSGVVSVVGDGSTNCALLTSGGVDCWGLGDDGELGNGLFYPTGPMETGPQGAARP